MEENKRKSLFRKVALDRLSSPEQLDRLMQVTNTRGWVALIGLCVLLGAGLFWGITGNIETTVEAQGLLSISASATTEPVGETATPADNPLEAVVYISLLDAERVRPGMTARISPVTLPRQEYGVLEGTVKAVGEFPATDETASAFGPDDSPVIEVRIAFEEADTPTGYQWSIADGPAELPRLGTVVLVEIVTEEQRPIIRLFPVLDDLLE